MSSRTTTQRRARAAVLRLGFVSLAADTVYEGDRSITVATRQHSDAPRVKLRLPRV